MTSLQPIEKLFSKHSGHDEDADDENKVVGPGPVSPTNLGVVVGDNVPFEQARANRDLARRSVFSDTYVIRAPGSRTASE